MAQSQPRPHMGFAAASKSFQGHLEGTGKARHTIASYRLDLKRFDAFLSESFPKGLGAGVFEKMTPKTLEYFERHLVARGLKTNSRRRILLTVQKFLRYLSGRKKAPVELLKKMGAPERVQRIPKTVDWDKLHASLMAMSTGTLLEGRNRALLLTLLESGCQVHELGLLKREDVGGCELNFQGKRARKFTLSKSLAKVLARLCKMSESDPKSSRSSWLFLGHNRYGALGGAVSPRGVELVLKDQGARLGFPKLTARMIRNSTMKYWVSQDVPPAQIKARMGLRGEHWLRMWA
ncbi:site-specific integrase [Bdellovibrionota bacterium FG-2]